MTETLIKETDYRDIPIPEVPSVAGWKEIPIRPNFEGLVPLGPFSKYWDIFTDSIYMGERQSSPYSEGENNETLLTQFVREDAADRLRIAQLKLPPDMWLVVFDAFRPVAVQQSFYDSFVASLKDLHPEYSDEEISEHAQKYVSLPSADPKKPSPHNTGGSVDLAIIKLDHEIAEELKKINLKINPNSHDWKAQYALEMERMRILTQFGQLLNFGTAYDFGGSEASLEYFEKLAQQRSLEEDEQEAQGNRRILYHAMRAAGFEPYAPEWWHFNSPKSQMGAKAAGLTFAEYDSAEDLVDRKHEKMRKMHRAGSIMIYKGIHPGPPVGLEEHMKAAVAAIQTTGDLRRTSLPQAEKMQAED